MSIIQAYKSDADGRLFEDKNKYQNHLRKLAKARLAEKKVQQMEVQREEFLTQMGQVASIDELNQFIKENWRWFWANGAKDEFYRWGRKGTPEFHEYVEVTVKEVFWHEKLRNSHSSPRAGVENFDSRADYNQGKPTSYPGWRGRINIHVRPPTTKYRGEEYVKDGWGSSYFTNTIICTGSGGGGGGKEHKSYSYDLSLWAADFPVMYKAQRREQWLMRENQERMHVWRQLGGQGLTPPVTQVPDDWCCPDPLLTLE